MPDLDSFEVFVAIAQTGSLGGAARELGLTQQAVSRRLATMEAKAGLPLAVRTTRGSQLTPAGVFVAEWASRLLDVARDIDAGLNSLSQEGRQQITVVASPAIAEHLMPLWLLSLQAANSGRARHASTSERAGIAPRVVLTASISMHAIASVRDGTSDLGFVEIPYFPKGLGSRVVGRDELVVVVPPDHKWARRSSVVSADEFARTPLISNDPQSGIRASLTAALQRVLGDGICQASPLIELPSATAMRAAVLAGAGPAAMSRLAVADDLAVGRLCAVMVSELDLRREFRAIWLGSTPPVGAVRRLLSHIGGCTTALKIDSVAPLASAGHDRR